MQTSLKLETYLSLPVPVRMGSFESTTYRLQQDGWELSFEHAHHIAAYRLAMRHPIWKVFAVSNYVTFEFMNHLMNRTNVNWATDFPGFDIMCLASGIKFQVMPQRGMPQFHAMDATPSFKEFDSKTVDIMQLCPFKVVDHSKDIILDPNDVPALMEHVLKIQSPRQAEIREEKRRREKREGVTWEEYLRPEEKMHAQIVTLVA